MGDLDDDINIFYGICYWGFDEEIYLDFIFCGNVVFGYVQCCGKVGFCFVEGYVCFSYGGSFIYMVGCIDSIYEDLSCFDKKIYLDQLWMGMVFCNMIVDEDGRGLWYVYIVVNFMVGFFLLII